MKTKLFLVSTSSSQCPGQSSLQPEAARVRTDFFLFSIIPTRNKEKDPEFFCSCLIIFSSSKKKNYVSAFSMNESEKSTSQSSNFLVKTNSLLERSAVIKTRAITNSLQASFYFVKSFLANHKIRMEKKENAHSHNSTTKPETKAVVIML